MIEIHFGSIILRLDGGLWWLEQTDGEAMEVSLLELDRVLQEYYSGNF
jgi:hypothetical protein